MSGLRLNAGCAEQIVSRLQEQLWALACEREQPVVVIGQSRGGALARSLAVREPEHVKALAMLGSPVCDPLAVSPRVLRTVRLMARLGDLGISRVFSTSCAEGNCCETFWEDMSAPLAPHVEAVSVFSRSDGIVDWQACLDPYARNVEVDSSHCGMSVHPDVYEVLAGMLAPSQEVAWSG
jgi:pimeloyl-ACP methyl ester carboxylesterase